MTPKLIAATVAFTIVAFIPAHGAGELDQWPIEFWKDFIQTSADSGVLNAFGNERFPLIETLTRLAKQRPEDADSLKDWLNEQMSTHFRSNQRDKAYVFKGFFTCLKEGGCNHLYKLDPAVNEGAEPFEPDLSVNWKGNGTPAGRIDWSAGKLAYIGKTDVIDEYWDDERGAYVMVLMRTWKARSDSKPIHYPIELMFYSPCTFTGVETRGFVSLEMGGYCPQHELFQGN